MVFNIYNSKEGFIIKCIRFWKFHVPMSIPDMRPSFLLPHNGSEIWIATLDNFGEQFNLLHEKILATEQLIGKPSRSGCILYHLEDTCVTPEVASLVINSLKRCSAYIRRLAFVGVTKKGRRTLLSHCRVLNLKIQSEYFSSMDEAKNWLTRDQA